MMSLGGNKVLTSPNKSAQTRNVQICFVGAAVGWVPVSHNRVGGRRVVTLTVRNFSEFNHETSLYLGGLSSPYLQTNIIKNNVIIISFPVV